MIRIHAEAEVARPPTDVSRFLADVANDAKWQKDIVHLALLEGKPGAVGATYERVQVTMGKNVKTTTKVAEHDAGKRVVLQADGKVIQYEVVYELAPSGRGTKVTVRLEGEMKGFASMFEGAAQEQLERDLPAGLAKVGAAMA